jgi:probable HAF family extracellular repeat protein
MNHKISATLRLATGAALVLCAATAVAGAPLYHVEDLGPLGRADSGFRIRMNDAGLIATSNATHAETVASPTITDLGTLGGARSYAYGIANDGTVVGQADLKSAPYHPFRWTAATGMVDLGLVPGATSGAAGGISPDGTRIVEAMYGGATPTLWMDQAGVRTALPLPNGITGVGARGVNDAGVVVGNWQSGFLIFGFVHQDGVFHDLGVLAPGDEDWDNQSVAWAVNRHGVVVGYSTIGGASQTFHAIRYENGVMQDLGALQPFDPSEPDGYSEAYGIDDHGDIVGRSICACGGPPGAFTAFLWRNGKMHDMNRFLDRASAGWWLEAAWSIDRSGQIAGRGLAPDGTEHLFRATRLR